MKAFRSLVTVRAYEIDGNRAELQTEETRARPGRSAWWHDGWTARRPRRLGTPRQARRGGQARVTMPNDARLAALNALGIRAGDAEGSLKEQDRP